MRRTSSISDPDPSWRELLGVLLDRPLSAEQRLEALIDHIERRAPASPGAGDRR